MLFMVMGGWWPTQNTKIVIAFAEFAIATMTTITTTVMTLKIAK